MFPLIRIDERELSPDFSGLVVTCDVDKTWLDTDFHGAGGLLRIPLEWATDKRTVPGMATVLRELRFGSGMRTAQTPLYFLTASPPQLSRVLFRKMLIDGVEADGMTCKDWGRILATHRRPAWLRRQIAYKLCGLLNQRKLLPAAAREVLIGDDVESDADACALYADLIAGRVAPDELTRILSRHGCDRDERNFVREALTALPEHAGRVESIYILLAAGGNPASFESFGAALVPCRDAFQLALHLAATERVRAKTVVETARDLSFRAGLEPTTAATRIADLVSRGDLAHKSARELHSALAAEGLADPPPAKYDRARRRSKSRRVHPPM
ncbi:MAG: hypothetical protein KJ042_08235 [Deltaproteobacteria bacterium]|nr:hypothetical protein [Deltaproteobacteria bacterium]